MSDNKHVCTVSKYLTFGLVVVSIAGCGAHIAPEVVEKPATAEKAPRTGYVPRTDPNSVITFHRAREANAPRNALQELNELLAEKTSLSSVWRHQKDPQRLREIEERRAAIHANELGDLQEVANGASVGGYVEEESAALTMFAVATRDIESGELLLFNADSVFRTTGAEFEPLNTTYVGWFFRPNQKIAKGERFSVVCIQDAPEEIWNVENHYMPHSDRARDPARAYRTTVR